MSRRDELLKRLLAKAFQSMRYKSGHRRRVEDHVCYEAADALIAAAKREERLVEALKPFTTYIDRLGAAPDSMPLTLAVGRMKRQLIVAEFRRARDLIAEIEAEKEKNDA